MSTTYASTIPHLELSDLNDSLPGVQGALREMGKAVTDTGFDKQLIELVKIRVSQINGCAYCTQLHLNIARQLGVSQARLDLLAVWRETSRRYSRRERVALGWAEALTDLAHRSIAADVYTDATGEFTETELMALTVAIANINAWNRICGPLHFSPPEPTS